MLEWGGLEGGTLLRRHAFPDLGDWGNGEVSNRNFSDKEGSHLWGTCCVFRFEHVEFGEPAGHAGAHALVGDGSRTLTCKRAHLYSRQGRDRDPEVENGHVGTSGEGEGETNWEIRINIYTLWGFPGGSDCKESACNAGDPGSIPGSGRSPGEGNDSPLQYSCLENPMDSGAWWATVHGGGKESDTTE